MAMTADCYFKNLPHQYLELSASEDQGVANIYATDPETGRKTKLLVSYQLKNDTPKDRLSMIFRFSNAAQKVSLEVMEIDDNTGMSTLKVDKKKYALNCDME